MSDAAVVFLTAVCFSDEVRVKAGVQYAGPACRLTHAALCAVYQARRKVADSLDGCAVGTWAILVGQAAVLPSKKWAVVGRGVCPCGWFFMTEVVVHRKEQA